MIAHPSLVEIDVVLRSLEWNADIHTGQQYNHTSSLCELYEKRLFRQRVTSEQDYPREGLDFVFQVLDDSGERKKTM